MAQKLNGSTKITEVRGPQRSTELTSSFESVVGLDQSEVFRVIPVWKSESNLDQENTLMSNKSINDRKINGTDKKKTGVRNFIEYVLKNYRKVLRRMGLKRWRNQHDLSAISEISISSTLVSRSKSLDVDIVFPDDRISVPESNMDW